MNQKASFVSIALPIGAVAENPHPLSSRPASLAGKTVGMVDNKKPGTGILFRAMATLLKEEYGVREIVYVEKPASVVPVSEGALRDLSRCHAIISGIGD